MSFVDFSRISSAKPDLNRNEKFSIVSIDIKGKSGHYDFHSASDLTPIKPSGTPNAKALKWFGTALGVVVSVALVITLIACLVVFLGNGKQNDGKNSKITTLRYQKDKISSTPLPATSVSSGVPLTTTTETESAATTTTTTTTTTTKTTEMGSTLTTKEMSTERTTTESTLSTTNLQTTPMTQSLSSTSSPTTVANGAWSNWGPWTMCAVTCGNSFHSRYRTCIKSTVNDTNCIGSFKEEKECTTTTCPVYGIWTTWLSWSNCDVTCGGGTQNRSRLCVKVANTDIDCVGRPTQQKTCSDWACPDCSRVCTIGTLNSECDACECLTNLQGLVRNSNGGLLNNVSIAHESAPYRQLTTTNESGTFELNNVCNQQSIILKRPGYQEITLKIVSSPILVTMKLIQYPVITTQPKSHLRLEGESVEFCCNATGNPAVNSYEWLKDGKLLNESFYAGGTTLTLTDLKFADSGKVVCRANSPAGAAFSDSVSLSVRAKPDDFCSDAYESYEINLPSDCIQAETNSVKYDIGKCSPKDCRKNNSNIEQNCSVDKKYCCTSSEKERRLIQCTGYSFTLYVTTSCSCGDCEDNEITLNGQAVGAISGLPLRFGTIEVGGNSVGSTGIFGDFSLNIPRGTTRIAVLFKDTIFNQFLDTLKIIRLNEELSGTFNIHVKMIEKSTPISIISNVSNTLQLGNQDGAESIASLTIPPNSIFYSNGTQYNGAVKASLNFFDPRNESIIENAPGEFVSIDQEGQTQNLQTFGVFSLSLQDQSGSSLQIAGETEIRLDQTYFESTSVGNLSDATLWGLNTETGVWEEQARFSVSSSRRNKRWADFLFVTLDISAYKWINLDKVISADRCYFKTQIFEGNKELTNYLVHVVVNGTSSTVYRFQSFVYRDNAIWTICKDGVPFRGFIGVEKYGKNIQVDVSDSGLTSSVKSVVDYKILEDNRTVSVKNIMDDSVGPFYSSERFENSQNILRFKVIDRFGYSFKVLNPSMKEAMLNKHPGDEVWYPPLNSMSERYVQFRSCFIKIGTENAGSNLSFRVFSINNNSKTIGIHEKGLINGTACIEYRCSGQNPDFDITKTSGSDFYRYPKSFTRVKIIPLGQYCYVVNESNVLRNQEKTNMGFSYLHSNKYNSMYEAFIPDTEYEGIYFHKSNKFDSISEASERAIKECNTGIHSSFSKTIDDMTPDVGLAVTFYCY